MIQRIIPRVLQVAAVLLVSVSFVSAQNGGTFRAEKTEVQLNVLCFKGDVADSERVDVYTSVPYKYLQFVKTGSAYGAHYTVHISIRTITGDKLADRVEQRRIVEKSYDVSRGSSGRADVNQSVFQLEPGEYTVDVIVSDEFSSRELRSSRRISVPSFESNILSMSSLMLVSSIEQRGERYRITPYVGDNISVFEDGFFVVFETYNSEPRTDSVDVVWEVYDAATRVLRGPRQRIYAGAYRTQQYIRVKLPNDLQTGTYTLRALLLKPGTDTSYTESDYLSRSERPLVVEVSVGGVVLNDVDRTIRQLRYVAVQSEIDSIQSGVTVSERRQLFEAFWRSIDPTPGTIRNEAFEEYYARVDYTEKNFRSYNEGWLTDMGMIYIVLGPPTTIERRTNTLDGRVYVVWAYAQLNRRFLFVDYSSFGDFRLSTSTPFSPLEKFRYTPGR